MKAVVCLPVTESAAPVELQRGHFCRVGPAFAFVFVRVFGKGEVED